MAAVHDASLAQQAYHLFGNVIVCAEYKSKVWYVWTGVRWERTTDCTIRCRIAGDLAAHIRNAMRLAENQEEAVLFERQYNRVTNGPGLDAITRRYAELSMQDDQWADFESRLDSHKHLIGFNNGVYDLTQRCFRAGVPEDMISMTTGYDYAPLDPDGRAMVFIRDFLKKLFKEDEVIDWKLQVLAQSLGRTRWADDAMYIELGIGPWQLGGNGKTTFFHFLDRVFGNYMLSTDMILKRKSDATHGNPFIREMKSVMLVHIRDADLVLERHRNKDAFLLQLTGRDPIPYRLLYGEEKTFDPPSTVFLTCNRVPKFKQDSDCWQKLVVTPYKAQFNDEVVADDYERQLFERKERCIVEEPFAEYAPQFTALLIDRYRPDLPFYCPESICAATRNQVAGRIRV